MQIPTTREELFANDGRRDIALCGVSLSPGPARASARAAAHVAGAVRGVSRELPPMPMSPRLPHISFWKTSLAVFIWTRIHICSMWAAARGACLPTR